MLIASATMARKSVDTFGFLVLSSTIRSSGGLSFVWFEVGEGSALFAAVLVVIVMGECLWDRKK